MKELTPEEQALIEPLLAHVLGDTLPQLEEAVGTGLDPSSVLVGMLMAQLTLRGRGDNLMEFLSNEANREIILAMREKVT